MTRERAINAPAVVLLATAGLLGLFALQRYVVGVDVWNDRFGVNAADLTNGRWWALVSYMGAHASWAHVGMNAVGVAAFGAPLARRLGSGIRGVLAWLLFFLIGGVVSGLLFVMTNAASEAILVGASGAVFALVGASTRLMNRYHLLEPLLSRRVLTMTAVWVGANLLVAFIGADPVTGVRSVAWQAHLFGLGAGLLLVGPWLKLFAPRLPAPESAPETPPVTPPETPSGPWG